MNRREIERIDDEPWASMGVRRNKDGSITEHQESTSIEFHKEVLPLDEGRGVPDANQEIDQEEREERLKQRQRHDRLIALVRNTAGKILNDAELYVYLNGFIGCRKNKDVADDLGLTERRIEQIRKTIRGKLNGKLGNLTDEMIDNLARFE